MDEIKNGEKVFMVVVILLLFLASLYLFNKYISPKLNDQQVKAHFTEIECSDMVHHFMLETNNVSCNSIEGESPSCVIAHGELGENFVDREMFEGCMKNDSGILEMIRVDYPQTEIIEKNKPSLDKKSDQKITNTKSELPKTITSDVKPKTEVKTNLVSTDPFCSISTGKGLYNLDEPITVSWISSNAESISWGGFAGSSMVVYPPVEPAMQGSVTFKLNDNGGKYTPGEKSISLEVMNEKGNTFCEVMFSVVK